MSRTYRQHKWTSEYTNLESYLKRWRFYFGPVDRSEREIEEYNKSFRDNNHENWKKSYRNATHRKMRAIDRGLINKIKKDVEAYENTNMSHKLCESLWNWD